MPALTITAVDNTTEQLTIAAHGLNTGDGPATIFVGTGGVIPTGLAPVTDVYVIRVDANTVKLATSSANALAGTAINITSNGTLPLQLQIGIPYRRARTYVPRATSIAGSQLKSADLNAIQDALVSMYDLFTGQAQSLWTGVSLAVLLTANAGIAIPTGQNISLAGTADLKHPSRELPVSVAAGQFTSGVTWDSTNKYAINSGSSILALPIAGLKVGDRINSVNFNHFGNASAYISVFTLNKMTAAGVFSIVQTSGSISTPTGAAWNTYSLIVGSPVAIATGEVWWLEWVPNGIVQRLQGANVFFDRP